jgi:hypothetical protein
MKEDICEYYPNKQLKHKIGFHDNGCIWHEQYYDQNGEYHRNNCYLPDYQQWYDNGYLYRLTFYIHGDQHNICNPADIWYNENGKIDAKNYYICDNDCDNKLTWLNLIKNI